MALESADSNIPGEVTAAAKAHRAARRQLIKSALAAVPAVLTVTAAQAQAADSAGSGSQAVAPEQLNALGIMQENGPLSDGGLSSDGGSLLPEAPSVQVDPLLED